MNNLWNLKNIKSNIKNSPKVINVILEEQAKYFEKALDNVLYVSIKNTSLTENTSLTYKLATNFSIVSPTLDNYSYILFTVYSNPEKNYPVMISINNDDEVEYLCKDETEFIKSLEKILGSEETTETISILYTKSKNY
ncbi:MAG: hypothetical protein ACRC6T_14315 [Sarcina sp.]